jgi:hypothetical protein
MAPEWLPLRRKSVGLPDEGATARCIPVRLVVLVAKDELVLLAVGEINPRAALHGASFFATPQPAPHDLNEFRVADDRAGERANLDREVVQLGGVLCAVLPGARDRHNAHKNTLSFQVCGHRFVLLPVKPIFPRSRLQKNLLWHVADDCSAVAGAGDYLNAESLRLSPI